MLFFPAHHHLPVLSFLCTLCPALWSMPHTRLPATLYLPLSVFSMLSATFSTTTLCLYFLPLPLHTLTYIISSLSFSLFSLSTLGLSWFVPLSCTHCCTLSCLLFLSCSHCLLLFHTYSTASTTLSFIGTPLSLLLPAHSPARLSLSPTFLTF